MFAFSNQIQFLGILLLLSVTLLIGLANPKAHAKEPPSDDLKKAHSGLNQSLKSEKTLEERIRVATWKLLLGEFASHPEKAMLFSGAVDTLEEGSREIDEILKELGKDREKWQPLAKNPTILARLDSALVRKEETDKKKELARSAERKRLETLRQLVKTYRDANSAMAIANTAFQTGDYHTVRQKSEQVRNSIQKIRDLAADGKEKKDWYLLSDEPKLDGQSSELKLVDLESKDILAIGEDLLDHLNALSAMAAYRLALADPDKPQVDLLLEAEKTLADIKATAIGGLALYVQGQVARVRGLLETSPDPLSETKHAKARDFFQAAIGSLKKSAQAPQNSSSKVLFGKDFDVILQKLENPKWFLEVASKEAAAGKLSSAIALLSEGLNYHRYPEFATQLVLLKLKTGANPEKTREYLEEAIKAGLVSPGSEQTHLVRGRLHLATASDLLFQHGSAGKESQKALHELSNAQNSFQQIKPNRNNANASIAEAYMALAQGYKIGITPNIPKLETQSIFQTAILATEALKALSKESGSSLEVTEALAAAYLARGMLAPVVLPDFRNEAQASLAAAAEVQARLPGAIPGVRLSGNSISTGILQRSDSQIQRLAIQERLLREAMGKLSQASTSLALGNSAAALQYAGSAYEGAEFSGLVENGRAAVPPESILNTLPTLDAAKEVTDQARAFALITAVAAGKSDKAMDFAMNGQKPALEKAQSLLELEENPLVVFAWGKALEGYAALQKDQKEKWLSLSLKAQNQAGSMMERSPGFRPRFPDLEILIAQAKLRLTKPEFFLAESLKFRQANNFNDSARCLNEGLALHPLANNLKETLLELEVDRAELGETSKSKWEETIQSTGDPVTAKTALLLGMLSEKTGAKTKAIEFYEKSLSLKPDEKIRVEASSRIALLKVLAIKQ